MKKTSRSLAARRAVAALACAPLLALTACGGGGGDGGTPVDPIPTASLAITDANAKPVAADALDSATNIDAARGASSFIVSVQVEPTAAATASPALRLVRAATTLASQRGTPTPSVLAVAINASVNCSGGGSLAVNGNIADETGNSFTAGDSVTLTASGCRETIDDVLTTMSGTISITVTAGSFSSSAGFPRHVAMTIRATGFSVAADGETDTANGDVSVDLTENSSDTSNVVLTGTSLRNEVRTAQRTRSVTMRNYRQALAMGGNTTSYTVTGDFETSNGRLGTAPVSYRVSTPAAMVASNTGDFSAGTLRVDGKASALLLTVAATNSFQLQVDADGDGTFGPASTVTLADLQAEL